jgi:hypothetical protein
VSMAKRKKHKHVIGKSADMALQRELHRQVGIIYSAAAIACTATGDGAKTGSLVLQT